MFSRLSPALVILIITSAGVVHASTDTNCDLVVPPQDAGETQAHGVILYVYPRSHTLTADYDGCQNLWFLDADHYRKLNTVHYVKGEITGYDNIDLTGNIGYQCHYDGKLLAADSDGRCPALERLKIQSYQAGCYSQSKLNESDSYDVAFDYCRLE